MDRHPPLEVRRHLRSEIGFGCPVPIDGDFCGNPYLTWHHFDPPWRQREHHDPDGMIAVCREHHDKADAGAYPSETLRQWKRNRGHRTPIAGKIEWLRQEVLVRAGPSFVFRVPIVLAYRGYPVVWLSRTDQGFIGLNIELPESPIRRVVMQENFWVLDDLPEDFECPPSGRLIKGRYADGASFSIEFRDVANPAEAKKRYDWDLALLRASWPLTLIEFTLTMPEIGVDVTSDRAVFRREDQERGVTFEGAGGFVGGGKGAVFALDCKGYDWHFSPPALFGL